MAVEAIKAGRALDNVFPKATPAYRFADALVRNHAVPDDLYADAVAAFGEPAVMVSLVGQYLAVSALLNTFRVPAPAC